jgi:hypothetical protein
MFLSPFAKYLSKRCVAQNLRTSGAGPKNRWVFNLPGLTSERPGNLNAAVAQNGDLVGFTANL